MAKTLLKIDPLSYLRVNFLGLTRFRLRLALGALLNEWIAVFQRYQEAKSAAESSELGESEIAARTAANDQYLARAVGGEVDTSLCTRHRLTIEAFETLVAQNPRIRTALNVGCRLDNVVATLAPRYPSVQFTSVDFGTRLRETHERIYGKAANWRIVEGYPLQHIRSGTVAGEVCFLCGVTTVLPNMEYRAYLAALRQSAAYLIISDHWTGRAKALNPFAVCRPEHLDAIASPVMAFFGGGRFLHNHLAILEETGYAVKSCTIHGVRGDVGYTVHIVATRL